MEQVYILTKRAQAKTSKIYQICNANIKFQANHIDYYRRYRWFDSFECLIQPPEGFVNGCFVSFVHIFVTLCKSGDEYNDYERREITKWLERLTSVEEKPSYIVAHVTYSDNSISVKGLFSKSIFDKIERDFGKVPNGTCIKMILSEKRSEAFSDLIHSLVTVHKKNISTFLARSEAEFLLYWGSIKTDPNWSICMYFSLAHDLYIAYNQMDFVDEICELYSQVHQHIFSHIRVSSLDSLPHCLQGAFLASQTMLANISTDPDNYNRILSEMSVNVDPNTSDVLRGKSEPKTIFSLLFQTIGVNLFCSLWHKSYSKLFDELCEFVMEFKTFLRHINSQSPDFTINHLSLDCCKWILTQLYSTIASSQVSKYYNNYDAKPFLTSGLCRFLIIFCQTLKSCLILHFSPTCSSISQTKKFSIPEMIAIGEIFPQIPVRVPSHRKTDSFSMFDVNKSVSLAEQYSPLLYSSQPELSLPDNKLLKQTLSDDTAVPIFPFSRAKICIERIIEKITHLPAVLNKNNEQFASNLAVCSTSVFYNTSILLSQSHYSRLSAIYLYETGRLYSMISSDHMEIKLYSFVMITPKMYMWSKLWQRVLVRQLESISGVKILSSTPLIPKVLSVDHLERSNVKNILNTYISDHSTYFIVITTLLYLSTCYNGTTIPIEACKLLFEYFLIFSGKYNFSVALPVRPMISKIQVQQFSHTKLNSTTENIATIRVITKFPSTVTFSSILLYFISVKSNSTPRLEQLSPIYFETESSDICIFEAEDVRLNPGKNLISLKCHQSSVAQFAANKIEFILKDFSLFYSFKNEETTFVTTRFLPPSFDLTKDVIVVPGMGHIIPFSVKYIYPGHEHAKNFNIYIAVDSDSTIEKISLPCKEGSLIVDIIPAEFVQSKDWYKENYSQETHTPKIYELVLKNIPQLPSFEIFLKYTLSHDYIEKLSKTASTQFQTKNSRRQIQDISNQTQLQASHPIYSLYVKKCYIQIMAHNIIDFEISLQDIKIKTTDPQIKITLTGETREPISLRSKEDYSFLCRSTLLKDEHLIDFSCKITSNCPEVTGTIEYCKLLKLNY